MISVLCSTFSTGVGGAGVDSMSFTSSTTWVRSIRISRLIRTTSSISCFSNGSKMTMWSISSSKG